MGSRAGRRQGHRHQPAAQPLPTWAVSRAAQPGGPWPWSAAVWPPGGALAVSLPCVGCTGTTCPGRPPEGARYSVPATPEGTAVSVSMRGFRASACLKGPLLPQENCPHFAHPPRALEGPAPLLQQAAGGPSLRDGHPGSRLLRQGGGPSSGRTASQLKFPPSWAWSTTSLQVRPHSTVQTWAPELAAPRGSQPALCCTPSPTYSIFFIPASDRRLTASDWGWH